MRLQDQWSSGWWHAIGQCSLPSVKPCKGTHKVSGFRTQKYKRYSNIYLHKIGARTINPLLDHRTPGIKQQNQKTFMGSRSVAETIQTKTMRKARFITRAFARQSRLTKPEPAWPQVCLKLTPELCVLCWHCPLTYSTADKLNNQEPYYRTTQVAAHGKQAAYLFCQISADHISGTSGQFYPGFLTGWNWFMGFLDLHLSISNGCFIKNLWLTWWLWFWYCKFPLFGWRCSTSSFLWSVYISAYKICSSM